MTPTARLDETALQAAIDASGHTAELGMDDVYLPRRAMIRALNAYEALRPAVPEKPQEAVAWGEDDELTARRADYDRGYADGLRNAAPRSSGVTVGEKCPRLRVVDLLIEQGYALLEAGDIADWLLDAELIAHPISPALVGDEAVRALEFKVAHLQAALASHCQCPSCVRTRHSLLDGALLTTPTCAVCQHTDRPITPLCDVCLAAQSPAPRLAENEEAVESVARALALASRFPGAVWPDNFDAQYQALYREQARVALGAMPPNQALDDIGVDDGATDGHAVSVNRSSGPSREAVREAMKKYGRAYYLFSVRGNSDEEQGLKDAEAALLALYRPAGETPQATVDEDDLCEDCLEQKATEFFETVPNQRCKDCTIKMLEEVCERMRADMPVAPDDPVTNVKDYGMVELWDDRCVQIIPNTGLRVDAVDASPSETTGGEVVAVPDDLVHDVDRSGSILVRMCRHPDFRVQFEIVEYESGYRPAPPAGDGDTAKAEERARWEPQVTEAIERLWQGDVPTCGSTLMQAVEHALGAPAGDGVPRVTELEIEELDERLANANPIYRKTILDCVSYCATRQGEAGNG